MKQNKTKKEIRLNLVIICFFIVLGFLSGCSDQKNNSVNKEPEIKQKIVEEKKEPEKVVYKEEIYGDSEIFSKPRLQFVWRAPAEKEETVWSTFLDGSDLRRVVNPELFFKLGGIIIHKPVRSPNNKYLAVSLDTSKSMGTVKVLYDLKEKTVTELGDGAFIPYLQWTANSESLYYYSDDFWKYNVKSNKKNIILPTIYSRGLYITNDDRIVALHSHSYTVHSSDGKEIFKKEILKKKTNAGSISKSFQVVSKDGELVYCLIDSNKKPFNIIFRLNNPEDIIYKSFERYILKDPAFGPENKKLYFSSGVVEYLNLETKEITRVFGLPGRPISDLTILNSF